MRPEATRTLLVRPPWEESVPRFERAVRHVATWHRRACTTGCVPARSHRFGR
jgi:hypothetical protein